MLSGALLNLVEREAEDVLTLTEGLSEADLLRSRLTRQAVQQQLVRIAQSLLELGPTARQAMPELDWDAWVATGREVQQTGLRQDSSLAYAVASLVPATALWLRVYRQQQPAWFKLMP